MVQTQVSPRVISGLRVGKRSNGLFTWKLRVGKELHELVM